MSKKQFHKLILHFVLTLAAIVVLLIAVVKGGYYVEA